MLEKAKKAFLYIVAPIAFVAGYIYFLLTQNTSLKRKLGQAESEKALERTKAEVKEADEKANRSMSDYINAKREYDAGGPDDDNAA
jgi:hypothetical protein